VTFSTKKYNGAVSKTVHVLSSDPDRSSFPLQIAALVGGAPATLGMEPALGIDFERFAVDTQRKERVVLTNYSPEAMQVSIIAGPRDYLSASLSGKIIQPRESVELTVETHGKPPLGRFSDAVTLMLDETHDTRLTVPIKGVSMMP
jgi:hypothetical protein